MAAAVRVRMYQVGFGDCFLVTFPGPQHMVVDCGSLGGAGVLPDVVRNIADETGGRVQVVVASHRHGEHVNGFAALPAVWNDIHVDEVWLPWIDDPHDPQAVELTRQHSLIADILTRLGTVEVRELAANSVFDQHALDVLIDGFRGRPTRRFLSAEGQELQTQALGGVRVHVVGPARTEETLAELELGATLARLSAEALGGDDGPFGDRWKVARRQARRVLGAGAAPERLPESDSSASADRLGFWLDREVKNLSLFLVVRYGRARLLFPGDAQSAAWASLYERPELNWELQRMTFYKVSHHGSRAGTPRKSLRLMSSPASMVSTSAKPWPGLPHRPLLDELRRLGPVVRSDRPGRASGFRKGPFWVDLELPA